MKKFLDKIRTPDKNMKLKQKIINTILIMVLGILLGIVSKWLDNLGINDAIWWQHIIGILDLRNVFSLFGIWIFIAVTIAVFSKTPIRASLNVLLFFIGMTTSYHLYTIYFCGFNPRSYMIIWYAITLITPLLAYICWYAKSNSKISIVISALILFIMMLSSFSMGMWYFELNSIIDLILFVGTTLVLYTNPKNSLYNLLIAFALSFLFVVIV